jgi:catechol 2,3-dioxygenase-like lactoylglutathione lyase family enzyme
VFGLQELFRNGPELIFLNTPGSNDRIALHQATRDQPAGPSGGILHFGFDLEDKADLDKAINQVIAADGALKESGEFRPGLPFAYVSDPDGYEIEL